MVLSTWALTCSWETRQLALFFWALWTLWLSLPFQKQMYFYPQSSLLYYTGACPKVKALLLEYFPFCLFTFFFLVWGLFGYSAAWGLRSCIYQICSASFGDVKWAVLAQNPSLLVVMFDGSRALLARVASLNWWLFALGGYQFLLVEKGLKWRSEWKRELVLLRQGLTVLKSDLRSLPWSAPKPGLNGEICTTRIQKQPGEKN